MGGAVRVRHRAAGATGSPLYAAYVENLVLALRKGEVLGIPLDALDLDLEQIEIAWQLQRVDRELLHRMTKTEASDASMPLPGIVTAAFTQRLKDREADKGAAGDAWVESGLFFTTQYGTPIDPRNDNRSFAARCDKAGVRRIKVHDTRHTCATVLVALDVHPRIAMQILRHSDIDVTMNVYTEATSEATKAALKKLGERLG
jgi:integrase